MSDSATYRSSSSSRSSSNSKDNIVKKDIWTRNARRLMDATRRWERLDDWQDAIRGVRYWKDLCTTEGMEMAWKLMDRAVQEQTTTTSSHWETVPLNTSLLRAVILAWSQNPTRKGTTARNVLDKLNTYRSNTNTNVVPDIQIYNMILDYAIKNEKHDAHDLGEEVIRTLLDENLHSATTSASNTQHQMIMAQPNTVTFNVAIDALSKSGVDDAPQRAETLLQKMKVLTGNGWKNLKPNGRTYSKLITTWANSRQPGAAKRMEELRNEAPNESSSGDPILLHTKELYTLGASKEIKPTAVPYGAAVAAFAQSGMVYEAQSLLQALLNEYKGANDSHLIPERVHFNAVINALAKISEKGSTEKAMAILDTMKSMAVATKNKNLFPDVVSFNTVLHALAKSNGPLASTHAENILRNMHEIDIRGDYDDVKPNITTYSTVLDCIAKSKSNDASIRAEAVFNDLLERYNNGDFDLKPNTITFNTVINAFSKNRDDRDAAVKAEAIFALMNALGVKPDVHSFNSLISAWNNSRDPRTATKAEEYLSEMTRLFKEDEDKSCKPDAITFSSVIQAWSTSKDFRAVDRARAILNEMKRLGKVEGFTDCKPNVITYTSFLNVIAKSKSFLKAETAFKVLSEMKKNAIQPDIQTYDGVLMACAFSEPFDKPIREKAFQIALKVVKEIHSSNMKASVETYCFFFQAAVGLGRDTDIKKVFKFCYKAGLSTHKLIQRDLMKAAPHLVRK